MGALLTANAEIPALILQGSPAQWGDTWDKVGRENTGSEFSVNGNGAVPGRSQEGLPGVFLLEGW